MNKENKGEKNIYLYIAVIFVLAVVLILASHLMQSNISSVNANAGLQENVARLSEENLNLQTEIKRIQSELDKITEEKDILAESTGSKESQLENYERIFAASVLYKQKKYTEAYELLKNVYKESLTTDALKVYDDLMKKLDRVK